MTDPTNVQGGQITGAQSLITSLEAAGVDREVIVADYTATQANLDGEWSKRMMRKVRRYAGEPTPNLVEVMLHSPEPVLRDTYSWIDDTHGGVTPYLDAIGVTEQTRAKLRALRAETPAASA